MAISAAARDASDEEQHARRAPPESGVRLNVLPNKVRLGYIATMASADPLKPLAEAASTGDAVATRRLLEAIGGPLGGVVRAVMGREHRDVEDVLQESLVGVVRALPSFRYESSVLHFARSIALRKAIGHRRSLARKGAPASVEEDELPAESQSPSADALARRRREAFRALLAELRPEQAEAFAQRVLFGYSVEEIALQTDAPVDTVKSRLRLAKAAMRARIASDPLLLELSEMDDEDAF